jgi:hypothetical protein
MPVTCTAIFTTREEALAVPRGDLTLASCDACSFVFNRLFDPALGEVGARYESSQAASRTFGAFAQGLAHDWIDRHALLGKTILEVGCGGGEFLERLLRGGAGRAIGIDPFADESKSRADDRLTLMAAVFDEGNVRIAADALVCRHTLEHIQDVGGFLGLMRRWAAVDPSRVLLFELPAAERVFSERAFWDVYYEHCNYFTEQTLRHAFEVAGLEVLNLERVYGDQYLVLEARAADRRAPPRAWRDVRDLQAVYRNYGRHVRASMVRCQTELSRLQRAAPPLVLWQGASKTVGFLSMLSDPSVVDSAVDLSTQRQGKFLPGSGLAVHAPAELTRLRPAHIVLMNPIYLDEVNAQVRGMGLTSTVHSVNSLLR